MLQPSSHIKEYIESTILPQYNNFDPAHRVPHANTVIEQSLYLAKFYNINIDMVYVIAAYHDTGLSEGRKLHHIISGEKLEADMQLRKWFSAEQIITMKEAVEDHRASSKGAPRSIYGKIVAEADRDIVPMKILERTVQYCQSHNPEFSDEQIVDYCMDHMHEKYYYGGYLKLWLPESSNAAKLEELRAIIADEKRCRRLITKFIKSIKYKIVVLDLDGTLTNSKKELSDRNREALIKLQEQEVTVVLASGRPTYGIVPLAQQLKLEQFGGYILSYNGGVIIECATGKEVYSNVLPMDLIEPLYKATIDEELNILSYDNEYIITENASDKYVQIEAHLNKMEVKEVGDFVKVITKPVAKCLAVGEPEKVIVLERKLKAKFNYAMNIFRSEPFFLELVPRNIDKAYSLGVLLREIKLNKEEMIAFGDGFNDLSMIKFAGLGVAMSNAQDSVKESANDIALSNDEDGVAVYLEGLFNITPQ